MENYGDGSSLELGKSFDRSYSLKTRFLDGAYDITIFFDKKSPLVLFKVNPNFYYSSSMLDHSIKISMYKTLEGSKFCETFLELNTYRNNNLDIKSQFQKIKYNHIEDINVILNETINLRKLILGNKSIFDSLKLFGLTLSLYQNEFFFLIAERQKVSKSLNKKIVRSCGLQISTITSLGVLDEYSGIPLINHPNINLQNYKKQEDINFTDLENKAKEGMKNGS